MSKKRVYLSLGSNVGDREENLHRAISALERERVEIVARSSLYETEPQDVPNQPWFLNMAIECETDWFPLQLLTVAQRIERELGRTRAAPARGPRTIDIDILLFGNAVMRTPRLTIPHPRLTERRFVLAPLLEIAPEIKHPETKEPLSTFLSKIKGQKVKRVHA